MCQPRVRLEWRLSNQAEPNLELDLKLVDLALLDETARLHHLEPIQVLEGLIGAADRVLNGLFYLWTQARISSSVR